MIEIILFNVLQVFKKKKIFILEIIIFYLDTCLHPGFIRNGKTYVVNYGTSRYILSANVSLRHGSSLHFECEPGEKGLLLFSFIMENLFITLGFMLVGNRGSTCFSGIWRPDQLPICIEGIFISLVTLFVLNLCQSFRSTCVLATYITQIC
jgi:hypothetical protein